MPRPGTDITIVDDAPLSGAILDTTQAFFVGVTERGPTDRAVKVTSPGEYERTYGERPGGSLLSDAARAFFAEGGSTLWVSRLSGDAAAAATVAFGSMTATAASDGAWGNSVELEAVAPTTVAELHAASKLAGDPIVLVINYGGEAVERSSVVDTADAAVAWSQGSDWVRLTKGADNLVPAAGTTATLAGGTDDNVADAEAVAAALARFDHGYGPGQVAAPGLTSTDAHTALCAHVDTTRRCALLDMPDSPDPLVLSAAVGALQGPAPGQGVTGVRYAAAFAPWLQYPGPANTVVTVPYSGVQAGLIAQADSQGNPNQPAAGVTGISRYALGLSAEFTDEDREALNVAGVDMGKVKYGRVRTYGYRTASGPDDTTWLWFGNSRVIMAIAHECDAVAEDYVLRQIDGRRSLFAQLETRLRGVCLAYFNAGALFGETPEQAFDVDTGPSVNTIDTIKNGEVHAVIRLKCSPAAEWVSIEIVKVPVERALPTVAA